MRKTPLQQAKTAFKKSKNILIITPQYASHDSICAAIALQTYCQRHKKQSTCVIPTDISDKLGFLTQEDTNIQKKLKEKQPFIISVSNKNGHADRIKYTINDDSIDIILSPKEGFFTAKDIKCTQQKESFDLIITLNTDSLEGLGEDFINAPETFTENTIVNIGTHITNDEYGSINLVDTNKSGVSEYVYEFLAEEEKLDETLATILLAGITAQTESFLGKKTNTSSFETAGKLQANGANHSEIVDQLFKMKSLATLKIWGRIMENLQYDQTHKISWVLLSKADFEIAEATPADIETITKDMLCHVGDTEIATLIFEDEGNAYAQISTSKNNIDIRELQPGFTEKIISHEESSGEITFENTRSSEAENKVLTTLTKFQQYRLSLPAESKLTPVKIEVEETKKQSKGSEKKNKKPSAPRSIPFSAPERNISKPKPSPKKPKDDKPKWLE